MTYLESVASAYRMLESALRRPPPMTLRWDGVEKLTVDGEPWFTLHAWSRETLAAAMLMIACPDARITDDRVRAFALEELILRDHGPFTMTTDAVKAWWRRR